MSRSVSLGDMLMNKSKDTYAGHGTARIVSKCCDYVVQRTWRVDTCRYTLQYTLCNGVELMKMFVVRHGRESNRMMIEKLYLIVH